MPKGQHSRATMNLVKVFVCSIDKAQTHHKIFRFTLHEIVPFSSSLFHLQCSHHFQSIPAFLFSPKTVSRQKKNASEFLLKRFCSSRRLPIFTRRFQRTIFGTSELNFCVRNGNRWNLTVIDTDRSNWSSITYLLYFVQCFLEGRAFKTE